MKNRNLLIALFALMLPFVLSLACASSGPPAIGNVTTMTGTDEGASPTTTYQPEDTFVVSVEANNMAAGAVISIKYLREGQLYDEGTSATTEEAGSTTWNFSVQPPAGAGHMPGNYTAEIYLDNALAKSVSFTVEGDATPQIYEVVTASEVDASFNPIKPTATFTPLETVNVVIRYKNILTGTIKTVAYFNGEVVAEREEEIGTTTGSGTFNWSLSSAEGMTVGTYTVEIFLDGEPYGGNPITFEVAE